MDDYREEEFYSHLNRRKQCSKIFPADLAKLADEGADIFFSI